MVNYNDICCTFFFFFDKILIITLVFMKCYVVFFIVRQYYYDYDICYVNQKNTISISDLFLTRVYLHFGYFVNEFSIHDPNRNIAWLTKRIRVTLHYYFEKEEPDLLLDARQQNHMVDIIYIAHQSRFKDISILIISNLESMLAL